MERQFEIENSVLKHYYGEATEVVIPQGVTVIGAYAFSGNTELQKDISSH